MMTEHRCQFILAFTLYTDHENDEFVFCDCLRFIKHDGIWLCAEHFDLAESHGAYWIEFNDKWLPVKIDPW